MSESKAHAQCDAAQPVCWRYRNDLGEVVSEWIDGQPPEYVRDANTCERIAVSTMKIDVAYAAPPAINDSYFDLVCRQRDQLREALEAVDSELVLTGQLKEIVDRALACESLDKSPGSASDYDLPGHDETMANLDALSIRK